MEEGSDKIKRSEWNKWQFCLSMDFCSMRETKQIFTGEVLLADADGNWNVRRATGEDVPASQVENYK